MLSEKHVAMRTGPENSYSKKEIDRRKEQVAKRQRRTMRKKAPVNAAPACVEAVRRFYPDYPAPNDGTYLFLFESSMVS